MKNGTYNLDERKIINYLRKNASNNENQNKIRNKLLSLFYKTIEDIPITTTIDSYKELLNEFPNYFHSKTREEIIKLFNDEVCPKKPIIYNYSSIEDYDIKSNNYLEVSNKTFRPLYEDDWKEKTKTLNGISMENQQSFYAEYLRYYLKFKKFPEFKEFLNYLYYKLNRPVHKDIAIVFENIEKSYNPIKDFIKNNNLSFKEVKAILIQSTSIKNRKELQKLN
jgi:hypothetical protein